MKLGSKAALKDESEITFVGYDYEDEIAVFVFKSNDGSYYHLYEEEFKWLEEVKL